MADVNITYETLFELSRRERSRDDLQKLDATFVNQVKNYILEKKKILADQQTKVDLFSSTEKSRIHTQLDNIHKILRELYYSRVRKIITMAMNKVRTTSDPAGISNFLSEEKDYYNDLTEIFSKYHNSILLDMINAQNLKEEVFTEAEKSDEDEAEEKEEEESKNLKKLRFVATIPKFIDAELDAYGPFEEDDEAEIPDSVARVLIEKGQAKEII